VGSGLSKRSTIRDVARQAEVSPSTVSRALGSNDPRVSASTRLRIIEIANNLGYSPNAAAVELVTGRSQNVGLIVPDLQNPYFTSIAKGVQAEARREGYSVYIVDSDEDARIENDLVSKLSQQVDGLVLCSPRMSDERIEYYSTLTNLVLVNRQCGSLVAKTIDESATIRKALEHLYALGHRHVVYVGGPQTSWTDRQRRASILVVTSELLDLTVSQLGSFVPNFSGGLAAADPVVATGGTAVIACNDLVAMGIIARLRSRLLSVPRDMSVVGIDDDYASGLVSPTLTSVRAPLLELGSSALDALLDIIDPSERVRPDHNLAVELMVRESTSTPR
jgi:DNA-binding LacI/PurR family transcriptional regulator